MPGLKTGVGNGIFWSEIECGFGEKFQNFGILEQKFQGVPPLPLGYGYTLDNVAMSRIFLNIAEFSVCHIIFNFFGGNFLISPQKYLDICGKALITARQDHVVDKNFSLTSMINNCFALAISNNPLLSFWFIVIGFSHKTCLP